jgi:hypothetical protein
MLLAGCDTFPRTTYSLGSEAIYMAQGEVSTLCERLSSIAKAHNIEPRDSMRSDTFCYFSDSDMNNLVLGARAFNEQLVVDVEAFNRMSEFRSLSQDLEEMLQRNYPGKYLRVSK